MMVAVDLANTQFVSMHNAIPLLPSVFHNTPIGVCFSVCEPTLGTKEHARDFRKISRLVKHLGRHYRRFCSRSKNSSTENQGVKNAKRLVLVKIEAELRK